MTPNRLVCRDARVANPPWRAERGSNPFGASNRIAIVGASARAAAFSALRRGLTPLTADLFADADLARQVSATRIDNYPNGFCDWLASTPADTPWMYTGALENYPDLVDRMSKIRPLIGCYGDVLRRLRDPLSLAAILRDVHVRFPETVVASEKRPDDGRWLHKTYRSSSGCGTTSTTPSDSRDVGYLQCHVDGSVGAATFYIDNDGPQLLGVTRQLVGTSWTHAAEFQYCGSIGPFKIGEKAIGGLVRTAEAIAQMGARGSVGIDFILDDDATVWVIEINPRYTASVELCEWAAEAPNGCVGKAMYFAPRDLVISGEFHQWAYSNSGPTRWPTLADIPHAGECIRCHRPVITTFAIGDDVNSVELKLQQRIANVASMLDTADAATPT